MYLFLMEFGAGNNVARKLPVFKKQVGDQY